MKPIFSRGLPIKRTSVFDLKDTLSMTTIANYKDDNFKMMDKMKETFNEILQKGITYDDYFINIFKASLSKGK